MGPLHDTKDEAFCNLVFAGKTQADAYVEAGYQAKDRRAAYREASRLRQRPEIEARIVELQNARASAFILSKDWVLEQMVDAHDQAAEDGNHSARIRSLELLGREKGAFTERKDIMLRDFSQMTSEEIEEFLARQRTQGIAPEAGERGGGGTGQPKARDRQPRKVRTLAR